MSKIILIALLFAISACKTVSNRLTTPDYSTQPAMRTETGRVSAGNRTTLIRQFENDIAIQLIETIRSEPLAIFPSRESLVRHVNLLGEVAEQMNRLDSALLTENNKRVIYQAKMLQISRQSQLDNWLITNHLSLLKELLPPLTYREVTIAELDLITRHLMDSHIYLAQLQTNLQQQSVVRYRFEQISSTLDYIESLGNQDHSPLLNRYQQLLSYSNLTRAQQAQSFADLKLQFDKAIYPAYLELADYLTTMTVSAENEYLPVVGTGDNLPANPDEVVAALQLAVISADEQITHQKNTSTSLRQLYEDPSYSLKNRPDTFQTLLDLLFLYVSSVQPGLSEWFYRRPSEEVILAAGEQSRLAPFVYVDGTALFDLTYLSGLPGFELETITYQYTAPGYHMLAPSLLSSRDDLSRVYIAGWAIYAMSLPFDQGYVFDELSKLGNLVRLQLLRCKALADINFLTGDWTSQEAVSYVARYTPYTTAQIRREVDWVAANPGVASRSFLISRELHSLKDYSLATLGLPLKKFHQTILNHSPATLGFLRLEMQDILKAQISAKVETTGS